MLKLSMVFVMALAGCSAGKSLSRKSVHSEDKVHAVQPAGCRGMSGDVRLSAIDIAAVGRPKSEAVKLPSKFTAYSADDHEIRGLMDRIKNGLTTTIALPLAHECITFQLKDSGVLSQEMKEKYPDIMSYRGYNDEGHSADIDFDGQTLKARITTRQGIYMFEPFETENGLFYLSYLLSDSGYPKSKFKPKNKK